MKAAANCYTQYGELPFGYGDYLIIPRGTIYQIDFDDRITACLLLNRFSPFVFQKNI